MLTFYKGLIMANINLDYSIFGIFEKESGVSTFTYKDIGTSNIKFQEKNGVTFINDNNTSNINEAAVKTSLRNLFNFIPGQRILDPEFGNKLYDYLFEPMNQYVADKIGKTIKSMIAKYESRVSIKDIEIIPDENDSAYHVIIKYYINNLGIDSSTILVMSQNSGISTN